MKEIREVLRKIYFCGGDKLREEKDISRAEAEIKKIARKAFLKWVGEDKITNDDVLENVWELGYNQAKAEIRKKVEGEL